MVKRKTLYRKSEKFVEDVVVLDFETTGLSPSRNEIIQIGAIKFKRPAMVDQFSSYAKASRPIPARISEITGITDRTVEDAPPLAESLIQLRNFIGQHTLVAHNANFDLNFLIENYQRHNISYPPLTVIDTLSLARKYIKETKNHKLTTLKAFLRMEAHSHDAIEDCRVTGQLYYFCKKRKENDKIFFK
ncbi:MAG: 3'-5' exonuclease [Atopostipes sp.]|nr:3'-5' exonuclease [Atopostipes sp.]